MVTQERCLTYVAGLLYFYGALHYQDLWQLTSEKLGTGMTVDEFKQLLWQAALDDTSPYVFEFINDICIDYGVLDSEWVLKGQQEHRELGFRPVSEQEAAGVIEDHYILLWSEAEHTFYHWLESHCGEDAELALALYTEYAYMLKNGLAPLELTKKLINELELSGVEEVQRAAELVLSFADATPMWILKGWRYDEVPPEILAE